MKIERWKRRRAVDQLGSAKAIMRDLVFDQPSQRRENRDDDAPAACIEHGQIAQELDRISIALFGVQDQATSFERFAAPEWLAKSATRQLGRIKPGLVAGKAAGEISLQKERKRLVALGVRIVRLQSQRVFVGIDRLIESETGAERIAEVEPVSGIVG